jgi:hypothetical protein
MTKITTAEDLGHARDELENAQRLVGLLERGQTEIRIPARRDEDQDRIESVARLAAIDLRFCRDRIDRALAKVGGASCR